MHRVDLNRRRVVALRIVAYSITLLLTLITTVVLLYVALGYRFDKAGHVTRSGLLLVDNQPEAGAVFINGVQKDSAAPSRFVLPAGNYQLNLKLKGYKEWSKQVSIAASGVREVAYPILLPEKLNTKQLLEFSTPELVSQSLNRKLLLTHVANAASFELYTLDPKAPKQTNLPLPSAIKRENGQFGSFKVIEWALNNKQVLLEQTLPSGLTQLISYDVTRPDEAVVVNALYGDSTPSDPHYIGGDTEQIYGLNNGVLSRYSLTENNTISMLENIRSYQPYSDDTILFDRSAAQASEVGIWQNKAITIVQKSALADAPTLLKYANYDGDYYFVIAQPTIDKVTIYRNPLKKPILAKQLPLTSFTFANTQKLDFSDSAQFILVQNGKTFVTYDLNDLLAYRVTLPFEQLDGSTLSWMDSAHIQAQAADGKVYLIEYDGQNQQALVTSRANTRLFFANNYEHLYQLIDQQDAKTKLSSVSLVAGKN